MEKTGFIEAIKNRYSCRSYDGRALSDDHREQLESFISRQNFGPFGSRPHIMLIASEKGDSESLKGLGTYGFIRKPAGFITGSVHESPMYLEDFGYCMERIILHATVMGLGTCWLGGSFKRSSFAAKAGVKDSAEIPAVIATGYAAEKKTITDRLVRAGAGSDKRKGTSELFFSHEMKGLDSSFYSSPYGAVLEMLRLAPSASNKQPWRIVRGISGKDFHFFMERTPGYNNSRFIKSDLQRVDMGIAMCHFELAARELKLQGVWNIRKPEILSITPNWEYTVSWNGK